MFKVGNSGCERGHVEIQIQPGNSNRGPVHLMNCIRQLLRPCGRRSLGPVAITIALTTSTFGLTGCSSSATSAPVSAGVIRAVGAENEYANVLQQIGGKYVSVASILDHPNTDPHTFEASTSVAQEVSTATLVVQNGIGYDTFMNQIEAASPNAARKVIVAQHVLGLPDDTPNPHLWYDPKTMPAVAKVMATDLGELDPAHHSYFQARLSTFDASLQPWRASIASYKSDHSGTPVAVTEPVADYLLQAMGAEDRDSVRLPGRHHEWRRSFSRGDHPGEGTLHQARGEGLLLQPAGGQFTDCEHPADSRERRGACGRRL